MFTVFKYNLASDGQKSILLCINYTKYSSYTVSEEVEYFSMLIYNLINFFKSTSYFYLQNVVQFYILLYILYNANQSRNLKNSDLIGIVVFRTEYANNQFYTCRLFNRVRQHFFLNRPQGKYLGKGLLRLTNLNL